MELSKDILHKYAKFIFLSYHNNSILPTEIIGEVKNEYGFLKYQYGCIDNSSGQYYKIEIQQIQLYVETYKEILKNHENPCKKVLFLDVDGVFTSARTGWYNWDIYNVNFIIWLCNTINAKIVMSSTWRLNHDKKFFNKIFPNLLHEDWRTSCNRKMSEYVTRGNEICKWQEKHLEIEDYLILDDDSDMLPFHLNNFIQTDSYNGIMFNDMVKILEHFNLKQHPLHNDNLKLHTHKNMFHYEKERKKD